MTIGNTGFFYHHKILVVCSGIKPLFHTSSILAIASWSYYSSSQLLDIKPAEAIILPAQVYYLTKGYVQLAEAITLIAQVYYKTKGYMQLAKAIILTAQVYFYKKRLYSASWRYYTYSSYPL